MQLRVAPADSLPVCAVRGPYFVYFSLHPVQEGKPSREKVTALIAAQLWCAEVSLRECLEGPGSLPWVAPRHRHPCCPEGFPNGAELRVFTAPVGLREGP